MVKKRQLKRALAVAGMSMLLVTGTLYAADEVPTTLDADVVEYDMGTGVITATGDVLMTQGDMKVTGKVAQYNSNTQEGLVEGNVIAVQPSRSARITADRLTNDAQQHMVAIGAPVHGIMEDKTFTGPIVEYFQPDDYILIKERGVITSKDGSFTADVMEGYMTQEHLIGTGNAYVVSQPNDLEAGGDLLNYYGLEEGKAVLTGNAWAVQYNNSLKSNKLTIILAKDGSATATE